MIIVMEIKFVHKYVKACQFVDMNNELDLTRINRHPKLVTSNDSLKHTGSPYPLAILDRHGSLRLLTEMQWSGAGRLAHLLVVGSGAGYGRSGRHGHASQRRQTDGRTARAVSVVIRRSQHRHDHHRYHHTGQSR